MAATLLETHVRIFMTMLPSILLRMTNIPDKSCRENQNTFYVQKLISENRAFYEIMWKNMV